MHRTVFLVTLLYMSQVGVFSLLMIIFVSGCAGKKRDPFDNGRLEKLKQMNVTKESQFETKKLSQFIKQEKKVKLTAARQSYDLPTKISEEALYSEVLASYQKRQLDRLTFMVEKFTEKYPKSIYADNAYYLQAQLELATGQHSLSLATFDKILKKYPTGNKYVAALFGKGVAYRKLQLYSFSQKSFNEVKKRFPGSPEFYKADLEEKLIQVEKGL